jgi:hypothetical protein
MEMQGYYLKPFASFEDASRGYGFYSDYRNKKPPFKVVLVAGIGHSTPPRGIRMYPKGANQRPWLSFEGAARGVEFEFYFADFRPPGYPFRVYLLIHSSDKPGDVKFWQ